MSSMHKTRSDQLFEHAQKFATPFRTSLGYPWALVPDGPDRYRGFAVASHGFRHWLKQSYHTEHFIYPSPSTIENAVRMFDAHAQQTDMPEGEVFTRLGWRGDRSVPQAVLLHLANLRNELIEITPNGHRIVSADGWRFLTNTSTAPLARPIDNGLTLRDHLRRLLNLEGAALDRIIIWLFSTLRPSPPYPMLVVGGPAGSGKTMLLHMLRFLIDPCIVPVQEPPATDRILFSQALHNHVVAYDEAQPLSQSVIDSLMRLASGTGIGVEGDSCEPLSLGRPVLMTAPSLGEAWMENAICIELPARKEERAYSQTTLAQKYREIAPAILGTLCDAVTSALSSAAVTLPPPIPRFAGAYRWSMDAAPILGLTREQIACALAGNHLVDALMVLLQSQPEWTGTLSDLATKLEDLGFHACATDPQSLSDQLASLDPSTFGIAIERRNDRILHLTKKTIARIRRGGFRFR